jgi:hypothetical protein
VQTARAAFSAVAVVVAVGCGLDVLGTGPEGGGASPSLDGSGDATVVDPDASGGDGAASLDGGDGAAILLPPVDGGSDAPTGLPGFCAGQTKPYFACWDFDDVEPGGATGFTSSVGAGGKIDVAYEGTNHVLEAMLPTAAAARTAWVGRGITGFGALAARYELTFAFGVRQSSLAYVVMGALWATTTNTANVFGVASYGSGKTVDMLLPDHSAQRLSAPAGTSWHQASVTLVPSGMSMAATVVVDGVTVQNETVTVGPPASTNVDVRFGTYFTGPDNGGVSVVFDDIVVRTP